MLKNSFKKNNKRIKKKLKKGVKHFLALKKIANIIGINKVDKMVRHMAAANTDSVMFEFCWFHFRGYDFQRSTIC